MVTPVREPGQYISDALIIAQWRAENLVFGGGVVENYLRNEKTASPALVDAIRRIGSSPSSLWCYRDLRRRVAYLFTSNIWLECYRKLGHLVHDFTDNPH
jgi:hypothetical protein